MKCIRKDAEMLKRLCVILAVTMLLVTVGCSSGQGNVTSSPTQPAGIDEVRQAQIAKIWEMKQLQINLESSTSILLKLAEGSEVSGYFYLTRGNNISFQISGKTLIYKSAPVSVSGNVSSDRFSFKSSNDQGLAYTLELVPAEKGEGKKVTPAVFLEIIYPASGEIFVPMETK
jgi:hypothetical protein